MKEAEDGRSPDDPLVFADDAAPLPPPLDADVDPKTAKDIFVDFYDRLPPVVSLLIALRNRGTICADKNGKHGAHRGQIPIL